MNQQAANAPACIDLSPDVRFSPDFRFCLHHGREYAFEDIEAGVLQCLVENYQATGFATMLNRDIADYAFPVFMRGHKKPRDVFRRNRRGGQRMNPAWGIVLGPADIRDATRLILEPPAAVTPMSRQRHVENAPTADRIPDRR